MLQYKLARPMTADEIVDQKLLSIVGISSGGEHFHVASAVVTSPIISHNATVKRTVLSPPIGYDSIRFLGVWYGKSCFSSEEKNRLRSLRPTVPPNFRFFGFMLCSMSFPDDQDFVFLGTCGSNWPLGLRSSGFFASSTKT